MNQKQAFKETVELAKKLNMPELPGTSYGLNHLISMWEKIEADPEAYSEAKLGRWLGWAQCALVMANVGVTLEEVKNINHYWSKHD